MTNYAHAKPGEVCTRCNDVAVRVVGTQALCVDHFDKLITPLMLRAHQRYLTPPVVDSSYAAIDDWDGWAALLREGVESGVISEEEADAAWSEHRKEAA